MFIGIKGKEESFLWKEIIYILKMARLSTGFVEKND